MNLTIDLWILGLMMTISIVLLIFSRRVRAIVSQTFSHPFSETRIMFGPGTRDSEYRPKH